MRTDHDFASRGDDPVADRQSGDRLHARNCHRTYPGLTLYEYDRRDYSCDGDWIHPNSRTSCPGSMLLLEMKLLDSVPLWDFPNLVSIELLIFSSFSSVEIVMDRNLTVRGPQGRIPTDPIPGAPESFSSILFQWDDREQIPIELRD